MGLKIAHFADVHILNVIEKLREQQSQFGKVYSELQIEKPDVIFIVGDFLDKFLMNNEAKSIASEFLRELTKYTKKVIITLGNHETNQKNSTRISSVESLIKIIKNDNIIFLNKTDFYSLDMFPNVVLTNWNWGDYINPYIDLKDKYLELKNNEENFFIDLYHNPINSARTFFGKEFNDNHYLSIEDFKGDLVLLGDIHQRQFFKRDGKVIGAYPSSLFQLNFGESIDKHGFLIWDINDKKEISYKEINIDSDYVYVNVYINEGFNYEDIKIELPIVKPNIRVKIKWSDYSSNINRINERAIKKYLLDKYSQIKEIKIERRYLDTTNSTRADEVRLLNINQRIVQKEVLLDYLKNVIKLEDETIINDILLLEEEIDSKLDRSATGDELYTWSLESFYLDNFRSHGDKWELNWKDLNGLWKIDGINEQGKTNLWSAICYLLYGQIIETKKKQKFGDNRFINDKRNLDYCECGGVISINEERFLITRRTERKWNRNHTEMTSCSTTLDIKKIDSDNNILSFENEEEKAKTIKLFEQSVGNFDDFLRTSVITGDTLNALLSMDESEFIDSILKDAGLDIFERKLELYKKLKKENFKKEERIVIDVIKTENEIVELEEKINNCNSEIETLNTDLDNINNRIKKGIELKETEIKKLHKIDETLRNLSIESIEQEIKSFIKDKQEKIEELEILSNKIELLPDNFDQEKYNNLENNKKVIISNIEDNKNNLKDIQVNVEKENNVISAINGDIYLLERNIKGINDQIKNEKDFIDQKIKLKFDEMQILEKSKVCPSCNQELKEGSNALNSILNKINILKEEIKSLEKDKLENNKIKNLLSEIKEKESEINNKKELIPTHNKKITDLNNSKPIFEANINNLRLEIQNIDTELKTFDIIFQQIENRKRLLIEKKNIPTQIENIDLKIKNSRKNIELFEVNNRNISENEKTNEKISTYQNLLNQLIGNQTELKDKINYLSNVEINNANIKIKQHQSNIKKFKEQERKEMVNKYYAESLSRDGIPRLLLLKMRDKINNELALQLQEVSFSVFFDLDLSLKLSNDVKPDALRNVIECCGKERTFASFSLKLALRNINNRSVNNMLLLDEVTGKLMENSVTEFFTLLEIAKNKIDKVIIIEHAYGEDLNPDYKIEVVKNDQGISTITF